LLPVGNQVKGSIQQQQSYNSSGYYDRLISKVVYSNNRKIILIVKGSSQQSLQIIDLNLLMLKSSRKGACPPPFLAISFDVVAKKVEALPTSSVIIRATRKDY